MTANDLIQSLGRLQFPTIGIGMTSLTLAAANLTFAEKVPISIVVQGAGNLHFQGADGQWGNIILPANGTLNVAVIQIAGNATTTATGLKAIW